ncbi:MAG: protein N-terminal glutamine amidohydrolase, partial [Psychrosphaera sp.]|nr:protein N-terminal glutamine amidohydrolase [Psychrosphaera sp.]
MNPAKQDFNYWPLFCEENVWQLCRHHHFAEHKTFAVFISNETKTCTLWQQQSAPPSPSSSPSPSPSRGLPVVWDYHVVLFVCSEALYNGVHNSKWTVWDLDSDLALGISVEDYLAQTFLPLAPGFGHYA